MLLMKVASRWAILSSHSRGDCRDVSRLIAHGEMIRAALCHAYITAARRLILSSGARLSKSGLREPPQRETVWVLLSQTLRDQTVSDGR
jgi:hypothetical protein